MYIDINTTHIPENVDQSNLNKTFTKYILMNEKVDTFIDYFKLLETSNAIDELTDTLCTNLNECISGCI